MFLESDTAHVAGWRVTIVVRYCFNDRRVSRGRIVTFPFERLAKEVNGRRGRTPVHNARGAHTCTCTRATIKRASLTRGSETLCPASNNVIRIWCCAGSVARNASKMLK